MTKLPDRVPHGEAPTIESHLLRRALGRFATGVTIVTCVDEAGEYAGLTANSFNSLSLDPPLVLWSLQLDSANLAAFSRARHFAVNVLAEDQLELSRRFASRVKHRFTEGDWSLGRHGAPVLAGCTAVLECATTLQQDAGDHRLFIGQVLACREAALPPLVYRSGHYHQLGGLL